MSRLLAALSVLILLFIISSCGEDDPPLLVCDQLLGDAGCGEAEGAYCLFGYKWGAGNNFSPSGTEVNGPRIPGGLVTFSFQPDAVSIGNHRESNVPTIPFSSIPACGLDTIRAAFAAWAEVADIEFEELTENSAADIRIFLADVQSGGNGFPNYADGACTQLSGVVILDPTSGSAANCDEFFIYSLHEIGHALGLGHVSPGKVMSPGVGRRGVTGLQPGDVAGIREIYGE